MCFPSAPKMPSAEEQAKQQLEIQRQLQADADSKAAKQLEEERKKAAVAATRARAGRRGKTSLITSRGVGGIFGTTDQSMSSPTSIAPLGSGLYDISNK